MVFKLFGFKGSLLGRRKEAKEGKDEVVCIGYRVNPEYLDSLPPPVLQSNVQASTSKGKAKGSAHHPLGVTESSPRLEGGKPNGHVPQGVIKHPPDHSNSPKTEVIRERKPVVKPAAKDLFKPTPRGSSSDEEKEKRKPDQTVAALNSVEQPAEVVSPDTFSTHRDSDNDRKSTLIFLTENHDDNEPPEDNRSSNIYEEMDVNKFERPDLERSSTEINFVRAQSPPEDSDDKIEFVKSNRFISRDHDETPDAYSSQASSLFFGESEPETVTLRHPKRKAPGRPSEADSETSA